MTHQRESAILTLPLTVAEQRLRNVESWTHFLVDVDRIDKDSHERYVFHVLAPSGSRDLRMVVRAHTHTHRFTWKALGALPFDGHLHLTPIPGGWTRLDLDAITRPARAIDYLAEMIGAPRHQTVIDVGRLESYLLQNGE